MLRRNDKKTVLFSMPYNGKNVTHGGKETSL
jgi:hypothetical protein